MNKKIIVKDWNNNDVEVTKEEYKMLQENSKALAHAVSSFGLTIEEGEKATKELSKKEDSND